MTRVRTDAVLTLILCGSLLATGVSQAHVLIFQDGFESGDDCAWKGTCSTEPPEVSGITAAHNDVRANADPPPSPALPDLVWSQSLAATAQSWADNCVYAHSSNGYGENVAAFVGTPGTPQSVVDLWASEAACYTYATNSCTPYCGGCPSCDSCGHYTQVVWRSSQSLGCGVAVCPASSSPFTPPWDDHPWYLWVCNYDPPGNFIGQRPY